MYVTRQNTAYSINIMLKLQVNFSTFFSPLLSIPVAWGYFSLLLPNIMIIIQKWMLKLGRQRSMHNTKCWQHTEGNSIWLRVSDLRAMRRQHNQNFWQSWVWLNGFLCCLAWCPTRLCHSRKSAENIERHWYWLLLLDSGNTAAFKC